MFMRVRVGFGNGVGFGGELAPLQTHSVYEIVLRARARVCVHINIYWADIGQVLGKYWVSWRGKGGFKRNEVKPFLKKPSKK